MQGLDVIDSMYNYSGDLVQENLHRMADSVYEPQHNTPKRQAQQDRARAMNQSLVLMHDMDRSNSEKDPQRFGSIAGNAGYKSCSSEAYSSANLLVCCSSLTNAS
jgi:hypothetical protein